MLDNIKNMYKSLDERLKYRKNILLFEGIFIIVLGLIALIFDSYIGTISVNYLLPVSYIGISLSYLILADKNKDLESFSFYTYLIGGLILLIITLFIVFNPITSKVLFVELLGLVIILKNIIEFIATSNKTILEMIKNTAFVVLGLVVIILSSYFVDMYMALLIVLITIGFVKVIFSFIIKNILLKK